MSGAVVIVGVDRDQMLRAGRELARTSGMDSNAMDGLLTKVMHFARIGSAGSPPLPDNDEGSG